MLVGSLTLFGPLSIDMYIPALPRLAGDLHAGAAVTQLTLTGFLLGLASGHLLLGAVSDSHGRRRPILVGLACYVLLSVLCAEAPSIYVLLPLRVVQGVCSAAGVVLARAIVRDLAAGVEAARAFSRLMLITGLAPILAPLLGAQLLRVTSWRGIFFALAALGATILVLQAFYLPETLPPSRRRAGGLGDARRAVLNLAGDGRFMRLNLTQACSIASSLAYISGSSFVLQRIYGLSPQSFSLAFSANALAMVSCAQLNAMLVRRVSAWRLLAVGRVLAFTGAATLVSVVSIGGLGVWAILPALFLSMASNGFVLPNATVLALEDYPGAAGTAAALLGISAYTAGALAAPLAGVAGKTTAMPMAIVMGTVQVLAALMWFGRRGAGVVEAPLLEALPVEP